MLKPLKSQKEANIDTNHECISFNLLDKIEKRRQD